MKGIPEFVDTFVGQLGPLSASLILADQAGFEYVLHVLEHNSRCFCCKEPGQEHDSGSGMGWNCRPQLRPASNMEFVYSNTFVLKDNDGEQLVSIFISEDDAKRMLRCWGPLIRGLKLVAGTHVPTRFSYTDLDLNKLTRAEKVEFERMVKKMK